MVAILNGVFAIYVLSIIELTEAIVSDPNVLVPSDEKLSIFGN